MQVLVAIAVVAGGVALVPGASGGAAGGVELVHVVVVGAAGGITLVLVVIVSAPAEDKPGRTGWGRTGETQARASQGSSGRGR